MNKKYLDKIKSYESPPKVVKIFSEHEIKMIQQLYTDLPERVFNKKQNIKKKAWIQNYNKELDKIILPNIKIVLSGKGRVGSGAKEVLDYLQIKQVSVEEFLDNSFDEPVYVNIDVLDYNSRIDNKESSAEDFYKNPQEYSSTFMKFCKSSDVFIAGHYHNPKAPKLISKQNISSEDFNIKVIADISCDIDGPIVSTIRPSTIEDPIYGYDPINHCEIDYTHDNAVVVMAVDNLPCELPRDASEAFGDMFIENVLPAFFNGDADLILEKFQFGRAHHRIIYFVGKKEKITIKELLLILKITKQSLSRVLNQLVKNKYVNLSTGSDKRTKNLSLTKKGIELEKKLPKC